MPFSYLRFRDRLRVFALACLTIVPGIAEGQSTAVTTSNLNLRSNANGTSRRLATIDVGDTVRLVTTTERNNYYRVISTEGDTGWVWLKRLRLITAVTASAAPVPSGVAVMISASDTDIASWPQPRARDGIDQVVFYHEGVGTSGLRDKYTGGLLGNGIENNIRELYRSILYNYADSDELFFFGFSRGAFTVRTLAGFMNKVGLIRKDADYYLPELYAWYESGKGTDSVEWKQAFHNIRDARECPPIKFVGVWDTAGSLGAPGLLGQFSKRILRRNRL